MNHPVASQQVILDGRLMPAAEARISPLCDGFMYGAGAFETIRVSAGRMVFWREHYTRLAGSCEKLGWSPLAPAAVLKERCMGCIAANQLLDGAVKIVCFQDVTGRGELITTRPGLYPEEIYVRGFALLTMVDDVRHGDLHRHKTLNYLKSLMARQRARNEGFDEALFLGGGEAVLEGAISSLFMVQGGRVFTPPLSRGILPGIARAAVLRIAAVRVQEDDISIARLRAADEVFVTNSILGIMPVGRIDGQGFDLANNPVTRDIAAAYRAMEAASVIQDCGDGG